MGTPVFPSVHSLLFCGIQNQLYLYTSNKVDTKMTKRYKARLRVVLDAILN